MATVEQYPLEGSSAQIEDSPVRAKGEFCACCGDSCTSGGRLCTTRGQLGTSGEHPYTTGVLKEDGFSRAVKANEINGALAPEGI